MSVTIKDVARLAGVSVATVSRVLNASAAVTDETRTRVLRVARDLRFSPNGAARSLSRRRAGALGVILPDLYGEFFSELLRGIDRAAQHAAHSLLVSSSHHDARGVASAVRAMRGRVDGLLVMAPEVDPVALAEVLPDSMPTVLLNGPRVESHAQAIAVDNYGGAYAMTRHLSSLGHRRIGLIAGPSHNADASERERGYRAALDEGGVPHEQALVVRGDFTEESGWRGARELIALGARPTAIFAANDAMAIGALSALRAAGLRVPEDSALGGFDDVRSARYIDPPLTTVRVRISELGARAVEMVARVLGGARGTPGRRDQVVTHLIVRRSCGSGGDPPPSVTAASREKVHVTGEGEGPSPQSSWR